jgi:heme/copper-type cytochrome/quinol oxidase subunit 2
MTEVLRFAQDDKGLSASSFMSFRFVDAVFWIAVGCCVIAQSAILHSVLRASPARRAESSSAHRVAEVAWAVIPGVALAFVLLYTWRAMR